MRMMLKVTMDTLMASEAISEGTLSTVLKTTLDNLKPEAAYFGAENGKRRALIFFDLADTSDIPSIAEPLFETFGAEIEFAPVMNVDDLGRGLAKLKS
jgi:hypothetical protein